MRTVLKIGGSVLEPEPAQSLLRGVVDRVACGDEIVIVHGGGKALTATLQKLGIPSRFSRGLRVTDAAVLDAALMVLAGSVNTRLVAALNASAKAADLHSFRAVGLSGIDGESVSAAPADPALGYVGEVTGGDGTLLQSLLDAGFTPVMASIASDGHGGALNVNADQFAAACAGLAAASRLIFVTDVPGVLDHNGERIPVISIDELEVMTEAGEISGGMLPKLAACRAALAAGVSEVEIVGAESAMLSGWTPDECPGTRVLMAMQAVG